MRRSLTFKWSVTLLLSSLIGVVLVGLFAYRTTISEFDRLRSEQAQANFIDNVTSYYQEHATWDGVDSWLRSIRPSPGDQPGGQGGGPFAPQPFALADSTGEIVVSNGPFRKGNQASSAVLDQGTPITINNQQIGTALLANPPAALDPREQLYLNRTNQALLIGTVGAIAVALLIGLLLSRQFLRPLTELTKAISAMKHGELNQKVEVRTHDELGQLAESFNEMSSQLHRANQLRKQMTADIAHDLRTPLMVITGYLEALCDGTLQATPERFQAMQEEAQLLQRLIDDLRTLSLAEAGELKLIYQSVKPNDLLQQVQQSFERIAEQKQVHLNIQADDDLPALQIDRDRMVQVLANLVSNALRYTSQDGSINLSACKQADTMQLVVQDTGKGIAPEKLANIFERFYRTEESRHQYETESGLGLAIAKSIVESHGGTITAASQIGQGTTLTITLPLQRKAA